MKFTLALEAFQKEHNLFNGTELPYYVAAEYLNDKNMLDYAYFTDKHEVYGSVKDFGKAVRKVFGDLYFTYDEPTNLVTKEEFLKIYTFGKFPTVKKWVPYVAKVTGKIIRKQDLFQWVLEQAPKPNANCTGTINE